MSLSDLQATRPLKSISAFITKGATPTTYGFRWERSGVPFLRSECVSDHGLDLKQAMFISPEADAALQRSRVRNGDILMTITGYVGRVIRLHRLGGGNINQHIARIRINDASFDAGFVYHFLSQPSIRSNYETITTGQAYPQISLTQVRDTAIPAVSIERQRAVAASLDAADSLITSLAGLRAKKRDIKQGLMQELLTGRTRLPGFTDSWTARRLGELGAFLKGRGIKRDDIRSSGVPCIRYGELYTTFQNYTDGTVSFVTKDIADTAVPIRHGDILFAGSGETKEEIGMSVAYVGNGPAVVGGDIIVLRGVEYDPLFLATLLNTPDVATQKARAGQGDAVVHINVRALAEVTVKLPSFDEQHAIARVLKDADDEIAALERRLESSRAIKQGMMQELLTGRTRLLAEVAA